jgi:ubiquinone/menaquinone biosynthesis C-methylase UbiE
MPGPSVQTNLETYDAADVAAHYAALDYLTPSEKLLFDSHIKPGSAVLDLGVGGGRTTRYLASRASVYMGVDYAASMVKACQTKFPDLEFMVADAANLSALSDQSFDAVVFAFNGIDYVLPAEARQSCIQHLHRVLKPGGCLIFSSHNPRAVLVRPQWNRERLRNMARRFSWGSNLLSAVLLASLTCARVSLALLQSTRATLPRLFQRVPSRAFWSGEGNMIDSSHGGLYTHYSVPARVIDEMNSANLRVERVLGDDYPRAGHRYTTDWYYYVFIKR